MSERKCDLRRPNRSSRNLGPLHLRCKADSRVTRSVDSLFYRDPRFLQRSERRLGRLNFTGGGPEQGGAANVPLGHGKPPPWTCYSSRKAWEKLSVKGCRRKASIVRLPVTIAASTGIPG